MKILFYFTKAVLAGILLGMLVMVFALQSDRLNLGKLLPSPTPHPIIPSHQINYIDDPQDVRMFNSANERAQCISSGTCEFTHDGWTDFVGKYVQYNRAGEVLGRDFETWDEVFIAWNRSGSHRDVLGRDWCIYGKARSADIFVVHVACE